MCKSNLILAQTSATGLKFQNAYQRRHSPPGTDQLGGELKEIKCGTQKLVNGMADHIYVNMLK